METARVMAVRNRPRNRNPTYTENRITCSCRDWEPTNLLQGIGDQVESDSSRDPSVTDTLEL